MARHTRAGARANVTLSANKSIFQPNQRLGLYVLNVVIAVGIVVGLTYLKAYTGLEIDDNLLYAILASVGLAGGGNLLAAMNVGTPLTHPADMPFSDRLGLGGGIPPAGGEPAAPVAVEADVIEPGRLTGAGLPDGYDEPGVTDVEPIGALTDTGDTVGETGGAHGGVR